MTLSPSSSTLGMKNTSNVTNLIRSPGAFTAACVFVFLLLLAAYSNFFHNSFHFDDSHVIETNLFIQNLHNIPKFFTDAGTFSSLPENSTYRPLVTLSLAFDYFLGKSLNPYIFHVTQFSLLLFLGILLYFFYLHLLNLTEKKDGNRFIALFATAVFCLHTANTETLNIISARSELLSTLGVVASFIIYFTLPRYRRFYFYLIPMMLGALAKTPAVMFAPLLFAFILIFEKQLSLPELFTAQAWPAVKSAILKSLPAFLMGIFLFGFTSALNSPALTYSTKSRWDYLVAQPFVWFHYLKLFFLPLGLSADTDWTIYEHVYDTRLWAGLLFIFLLLRCIWKASQKPSLKPVVFGLVWFVLALLPSSSIFPLEEVYNEHRIFFPYIGLTLAVVYWIIFITKDWRLPLIFLMALLLLTAEFYATHERNKVWKTEATLWQDVVQKSPKNGRALMNYGLALMSQGKLELAKFYFDKAKLYTPNYPSLETNLGIVNDALGDPQSAEKNFRRALQLKPNFVNGHHFYARWLIKQGRSPEAIEHLKQAIQRSPASLPSRFLLIKLYASEGKSVELNALLQESLAIAPQDSTLLSYVKGRALPLK